MKRLSHAERTAYLGGGKTRMNGDASDINPMKCVQSYGFEAEPGCTRTVVL